MTSKLKTILLSVISVLLVLLVTLGILYSNNLSKMFKNKDTESISLDFKIDDNIIKFTTPEDNNQDIVVNIKPVVNFSNNLSKKLTATYDLELNILKNLFIHSNADERAPEITLNVIDPEGNEIKEIMGFDYTEKGFDITGFAGPIKLMADYPISYKNKVVSQTWDIKVTFNHMEVDQSENYNKDFEAEVVGLNYKVKTD